MLGVLVLLIAVFAAGAWLNAWVEPQLQVIARQQTGIALNNIVQKVISTLDYDVEELVHLQRGEDGQILTLDYDTYALNQILKRWIRSTRRWQRPRAAAVIRIWMRCCMSMASSIMWRWAR